MKNVNDFLSKSRRDYSGDQLSDENIPSDPQELFRAWLEEALSIEQPDPHAMVLATADKDGKPAARVVLLRGFGETGFVFYTNYNSRKGVEILDNPHGTLLFYWPPIAKQIRIEGRLEKVA